MKYILSLLLITSATLGCSVTNVKVHTNPSGADVYARPVGGGDLQLVGKTPLFIESRELDQKFGNGAGAIYMEFRKDGYKTDKLFVTEISRIDLSINKDMVPKRDLEMQYWMNHHISEMFEVRRLVNAKRYGVALEKIRQLKEESPMISKVHEMEAGVLLLKRSYREALDAYRLSIKYDPENQEAVKMVRYLERTYGFPKQIEYADHFKNIPGDRKPTSAKDKKEAAE